MIAATRRLPSSSLSSSSLCVLCVLCVLCDSDKNPENPKILQIPVQTIMDNNHHMKLTQTLSIQIISVLAAILTFGCLLCDAQAPPIRETDPQHEKSATVQVIVKTDDVVFGSGSGFFIRQDLIVTNIHVVASMHGKAITCREILVDQPKDYTITGVVASDPEHDLVILKVDGQNPDVLQLSDSDAVALNDEVIAIGTHANKTSEIVKGTINRITPRLFQVKASIPSGFSGAPVLNNDGDVIGICVTGGDNERYSYVIPSNYLNAMLKDMPLQVQSLENWREQPSIRAYGIVVQADEKRRLGAYKDAIKSYDSAIFLMPDFAVAYSKRASTKINLRDYKGVVRDYDMAILLGEEDVGLYINRGVAKRTLGNYIGALEDCETAIQLDPENIEAFLNRGDTHAKLRNYELAIQDYNTAISLNPNGVLLALLYLKRADVKSDFGDKKGAIADYNKTIELQPNNTSILTVAYLNRGITRLNLGEYEDGIKDLDEVIRLKQNNDFLLTAYINRANAKSKSGDNLGAVKDYSDAIRFSEPNTRATANIYSKRAAVKVALSDNIGAIEDCGTALQIDPDLSEAYKIRGDAKSNMNKYKEAIADYNMAIYLQPDFVTAYYMRGKARIEIDNVFAAKIDFRTALKFAKCEDTQYLQDEFEKTLRLLN